ncbi:M48 family metallopeptidase [Oceaniserpentilla sp. 4NH20-0058]|uniref:M48 family metalloprotease n=1 Tax=Oceaniserpentilla sp. 4NH20-0058 TaxID=3127660 RepID=UPI00310C7D5D
MDFFEHQAQAKAASQRLLLLFLLICFVFVILVNGLLFIVYESNHAGHFYMSGKITLENFVNWQLSWAGFVTSLVSVFIISIGCISRWFELRKGGNGLAIKIGARSLGFASKDEKEQKLINVVEEMAIASGIMTPSIYVLDNESAINAFVAGYTIEDTALVVTRGLINSMNREELQAVVGHEFSHILHGDNQVNIRLLVLIAGFVWVSEIGRFMMTDRHRRHKGYPTNNRLFSTERHEPIPKFDSLSGISRKHRETIVPVVLIAIPIFILGYVGSLFGSLIRTAISRKREYLADASSVQFTRNPQALASALNVIFENSHQGQLRNSRADEISHMCISGTKKYTWFATHPPLEKRINAIDDTFLKRIKVRKRKEEREVIKKQSEPQFSQVIQGVSGFQQVATENLSEVVGEFNPENLAYAMSLHNEMPPEFRNALYDPHKTQITLLFLLLENDAAIKKAQLAFILKYFPQSKDLLTNLLLISQGTPKRLALPLVELMLPVLKTLADDEKKKLLAVVLKLAKWDGKLTLFEISLYTLLKQSFEGDSFKRSAHSIKKMQLVAHELNIVVCSLIHHSGGDESEKQALQGRMLDVLGLKPAAWLEKDQIKAKDLYTTLKKLKSLAPMLKRSLMDVCGDIVLHDGIVHHGEYETLRLMSLVMACPMPLLPKAV